MCERRQQQKPSLSLFEVGCGHFYILAYVINVLKAHANPFLVLWSAVTNRNFNLISIQSATMICAAVESLSAEIWFLEAPFMVLGIYYIVII